MPTEELKFEDLIKEYIEVIENTDVKKLKEENKVIEVDIERKGKEVEGIETRIEEIQSELDSLNENSTVKLEYPEAIKDKEDKIQEAKDFKENKGKEIAELKEKAKANRSQITKANTIGNKVIKKAEEKTNKENEELQKKIEELKIRKAKYGIKRKNKDGKETIQLTKEEKIVVSTINKDILRLKREIENNNKALSDFKDAIKNAKKDKEVYLSLKNKVKEKEETNKEEPKEKPSQEKNNEPKPKNEKEQPKKDDIEHEEIPVTPTGKTSERTDNNNPTQKQPTGKTEKKIKEEEPKKEPRKVEQEKVDDDSENKSNIGIGKEKGEVPGVPQPEYEIHEVKDPEENKDIYSNSYNKSLTEYKMSLEIYNQDLETLYDLQSQYENGQIEYAEYEKHANYMVERYRFIKEEYGKVKNQYETEKGKKSNISKINKLPWHPDLTEEQIHYIKSELDIYEPVGQEYEQALRGLGLDPSKQPKQTQIEEDINLQWHPDLTQEQIDWLISEKEIYKPVGQEYEQALRELGLDPNKQIKGKDNINLEEPEKPEQPMMVLEKEIDLSKPEVDYDAIEEEYAYRKQDMVDKFMGNREKAKEYEKRLNRFKDHIIEKEFEYVDENGRTCRGTYKTIEGYEEYAKDAFFLQLEEYKDRLEDMTKFDAGDKSIYKDIKIGDRVITAQEQRDKDNDYVKTYNNAYNSHVHTQKNLMTLGNYGDKLPYSEFKKKQPIRNILRGAGNVLKFARNWTIAPVSRFVGKRIVAPIHKAIYKPEQSNPNPYKGRLTHRYEQRKNYFREQGKGYFRSSIAALFKYKEGNRGTLAARGGEIFQSIENKHIQKAEKEAEAKSITNKIQNTKEKIDRVKEKLQNTNDEKEKAELDKELSGLIQVQTDLQKERYDVLNKRVSQTVQTDSIDNKTHDRANKRTITRAVTTVKALAIGATRYFGPKLHKRIIERTREEVVTWKKGPDTVVNSKQYVEGNYEDLTIGDYMEGEATGTYAVDGMTPHHAGMTPKAARGFAYRDGSAGDGYTSFIDGNGMTAAEVARYADKRVPADLLDAAGNLDSTTKMVNLAKEVGVQINSKADYDNFINNIELCLSESSRKIPSGWVGSLSKRLGKQITDGHWATVATTVPGKMQKVIEYADDETVKNILDMIRKGTDKVIIADVIDQVYQNVRETEGKGNKFGPNRNYGFDDKGKTKGPEGFDYDRRGRNKNTGKKFIPTYSSLAMSVLASKSVDEIKEKLSGIKISELTQDERTAISQKMEELHVKEKSNNEQYKSKEKTPRLNRNKNNVISKAKTMATSLGKETIGGFKIAGSKFYGILKGKNPLVRKNEDYQTGVKIDSEYRLYDPTEDSGR